MSENEEVPQEFEAPGLSSWLLSFLSVRRKEYEEQYGPADSFEAEAVERAIDALDSKAASLVTTGLIPPTLAHDLADFEAGADVAEKVRSLMRYRIVHHRLEFDVAEDVCERLDGLDERVEWMTLATVLLIGYNPTASAVKYFNRAAKLFLAGYDTETFIMCGAVLESALSARITDEMLTRDGMRPVFRHSGNFSLGQRLSYEERYPIFTDKQRESVRKLINWRNDAAHVQPDLGPKPQEAILRIAAILPVILPSQAS